MISKDAALKQLLEFYGIAPHHDSPRKGDQELVKNLEGCFSTDLVTLEKQLGFDTVRAFYEGQMRRVGKEVSAMTKRLAY